MSQPASASSRYPARKFPLDIGTYAVLKQQLAEFDIDLDLYLRPVVNDRGYVQLEHNLNGLSTYKLVEDHIRASVIPVFETDEFAKIMSSWAALSRTDQTFLTVPMQAVRTKLAEKLGGQSFLAVLDDFQQSSVASIQQLADFYARYAEDIRKRSELASGMVKFTEEWPIGSELQLVLAEMKLKGLSDAIVSVVNYYSSHHAPGGVKVCNLLTKGTLSQYMDITEPFKASQKRVKVVGNLISMHLARLTGQTHPPATHSSHLSRLSSPAEQAYEMARHKLADVQLDVDDLMENKQLAHSDLQTICSHYIEQVERKIRQYTDPYAQAFESLKQRWKETHQMNPAATADDLSLLIPSFFASPTMLDAIVTYMLILLRGYTQLVERDIERFEELIGLVNRHRDRVFIHHETEYLLLWSMQTAWKKQVPAFLSCFSFEITPGIKLQACLTDETCTKLDQFIDEFNASWKRCKLVRKRGMAMYQRIVDDRQRAVLQRERPVSQSSSSSSQALPTPVSYPKMEPSNSEVDTPKRRIKKVKTRRPAAAAAAEVESNSSSRSSSSSDDEEYENSAQVTKNEALAKLRVQYKKHNPDWTSSLVRAAAKNQWWAEKLRKEQTAHEIETMRQRVANINTADELPSFAAHPPNIPHPRSFAALSAAHPTSEATSSSSSTQAQPRPNQPMSLDQFLAWQEEESRKRAVESRVKKRQQQRK